MSALRSLAAGWAATSAILCAQKYDAATLISFGLAVFIGTFFACWQSK